MKPQKAVLDETRHIAIGTLILGAVMLLVFALLGRFSLDVLLGALFGMAFAIGNFFMLGMTVQKATANPDRAKATLQNSYTYRMLAMIVFVLIGVKLPFINWIALAIPLVFPRIVIFVMQITGMVKRNADKSVQEASVSITELENEMPVAEPEKTQTAPSGEDEAASSSRRG